MNRKIKFRLWDIPKNEWYKPIYEADEGRLHDISITRSGKVLVRTLERYADLTKSENYIINQFTGLTDKNGKEIYEGDVLKITYIIYPNSKDKRCIDKIIISEVYYNIHICAFVCKEDDGYNIINHRYMECEVIGNIYENPELIK